MAETKKTERDKVAEVEEHMPSRADPRRGDTVDPGAMIPAAAGLIQPGTGDDEPMTSKQADELRALSEAHGEPFDSGMTRAAAARKIDELKAR